MKQLIAAHFRALKQAEKAAMDGEPMHVLTHRGVVPIVVKVIRPGVHSECMSRPAFAALREAGYVTFEQGDGYGPWPLKLTGAGVRALGGPVTTEVL